MLCAPVKSGGWVKKGVHRISKRCLEPAGGDVHHARYTRVAEGARGVGGAVEENSTEGSSFTNCTCD